MVTDGAGYHQDTLTEKFANLSTLQLPGYSPELNPIEQVWSWLRQHNLANQCFENYKYIVNKGWYQVHGITLLNHQKE